MASRQVLIDFENVQPSLEELHRLVPGFTDVWLFHGPHQARKAKQWALGQEQVTVVPRSGHGSNALDFHLCFYLGYVAARNPDAHLVVIANDRGYDPMLVHARLLAFTAKRVGFRPRSSKSASKASPDATAAVAKKAATKKAPAKQGSARKASAKKTAVKRAPAKRAPLRAKAATHAVAPKPEARLMARVTKAVRKMGQERPVKLRSLLRHVAAMMGEETPINAARAMVSELSRRNVLSVTGEQVTYH